MGRSSGYKNHKNTHVFYLPVVSHIWQSCHLLFLSGILDEHAADRVRERLRKVGSPAAEISILSEQERKIITYIGDGLTNKQISEQMFIAEKTVKNYVSSLLAKLSLDNRAQAASLATRVGLRPDSNSDLPSNS